MKKVIGIIASTAELKERIESLYKEDVKQGNIIIDLIDIDKIEEQGKILKDKGAQAIIGRGGGYKLILDTVNIPIIPFNMKVIDILKAIKLASLYCKKVVLVLGYDEVFFNYDEYRDLIDSSIKEEWFKSKFEIESKVSKYINEKNDVVIVGSGIACSFAQRYGMDSIFINASDESIRGVVDYCKNLLDTLEDEKFNNEILRNTLDGIKDGVIATDIKGNIVLYNEGAKKILKSDKNEVFNKYILDVFPSMEWLVECLSKNIESKRKIRYINDLTVNTSGKLIKIDDDTYGVLGIIQDITKLQNLERKIRIDLNKKGMYAKYSFDDFIFKDEVSKEFIEEAKSIGVSDYTVLLYGESGSGKEILAHSIHNISTRKNQPFVAINCATIAESLLESELFGYEEGAFTGARKGGKLGLFELAHGGTLFLDEINSLPLNLQAKLLRVIEEREIMRLGSDRIIPLDIRIIAATNEFLYENIKLGTFRADLYYRLSSLEINIPPLRERKKDILILFDYFVKDLLKEKYYELSEKEQLILENYNWPGNVRELKNIAQKYFITGKIKINENEVISIDQEANKNLNEVNIDMKAINKYIEEKIIETLLNQGLTKTEIAKILGISRTALWKKYNKK
ncbi:PAS domain S-box protein [Romboutsia weinsteinii]|uniref:PAS domain S-box protein n=1 Tax=Romboutsia weinsteinii TaxID=2020949 RepID=A0A371IYX8_9FIRM|nr:sigma 54-interacting transcriptional regulator [Romboutsia weinsteinii]RDY25687.1 PAS domain S-box protein [Romboutsia weinsteinii]